MVSRLSISRTAFCLALAFACSSARAELSFKVRPDRPRVFVRADDWTGPSVPKLRRFYNLPEYEQRGIKHKPVFPIRSIALAR